MIASLATLSMGQHVPQSLLQTCSKPVQVVHAESDERNGAEEFQLDQLTRYVTEVSEDKVLFGGSHEGRAALVQVDLFYNKIDFAKVFSLADSVVAISEAPEHLAASHIVLVSSIEEDTASASIIELGLDGSILQEPIRVPVMALAGQGSLEQARFSITFDSDSNVVIAFGHESLQIVVVNTRSRTIFSESKLPLFVQAGGSQAIAKSDKILLAGQLGSEAAIIVLGPTIATIKIPQAVKVVFLSADVKARMVYGLAIDSNNDRVRFSVQTDADGNVVEGSMQTGPNCQLNNQIEQLIVTKSDQDHLFLIYDLWYETEACSQELVDRRLQEEDPCLDKKETKITPTPQAVRAFSDKYSGVVQQYQYTDYTVTPDTCTLTEECGFIRGPGRQNNVLKCKDYGLDESKMITLTAGKDDYLGTEMPPGRYSFYFTVSTGEDSKVTSYFGFNWLLQDPCNTYDMGVTMPQFTDQMYTITDVEQILDFQTDFNDIAMVDAPFTDYCTTELTFSTSDATLTTKFSFSADDQTLTLSQISDALDLSGSELDEPQTSVEYTITINFVVTSPFAQRTVYNASPTFMYTIKNPCIDTDFVVLSWPLVNLTTESYLVSYDALEWDPYDKSDTPNLPTVTTTPITHALCGSVKLSSDGKLSSDDEDPVTYDDGTNKFKAETSDYDLIGTTANYSLIATLNDYPSVSGLTKEGSIEFLDPCSAPMTFVVPTQDNASSDLEDNFSDTPIDFYLNEMTVTPSRCVLTYTCTSVAEQGEASSSISCSDFEIQDPVPESGQLLSLATPADKYGSPYRPGTYTVTITGSINDVTDVPGTTSMTTTFDFTLLDPCDPPTITVGTPAAPATLDYTISQVEQTVDTTVFSVEPSYCLFNVVKTIETLEGGQTPITENDTTFSIFYDSDTDFVDETQTVTITATTYTEYPATEANVQTGTPTVAAPASVSDSFVVTYLNPCFDVDYTTVIQQSDLDPVTNVIQDKNYIVYDDALEFVPIRTFEISTGSSGLCGVLKYTATYDDVTIDSASGATGPISFSDGTQQYTIDSEDDTLITKVKNYSLKVEMEDYPTETYPTADFKEYSAMITYLDPTMVGDVCQDPDITTLIPSTQSPLAFSDSYSDSASFTYEPYTTTPSICETTVEVKCKTISGPTTLSCDDYEFAGDNTVQLKFTQADYTGKVVAPGDYTFEYEVSTGAAGEDPPENTVSADGDDPPITDVFSFVLTLEDICGKDVVTVLTKPDLANRIYFISDEKKKIIFSAGDGEIFTSDPSFCRTEIVTTTSPAELNAKLTVDEEAQTMELEKITDSLELSGSTMGEDNAHPTTVEYEVSVNYKVYSEAPGSEDDPKIETVTFEYKIKNPCVDQDYVTITSENRLKKQTYVISSEEKVWPNEVVFTKTGDDDNLCGDIIYIADIKDNTNLAYDADNNEWSLFGDTEDFWNDFKDVKNEKYALLGQLEDWPKADYSTAISKKKGRNIDYKDPCKDADYTTLTRVGTRDNSIEDDYSGTDKVYTYDVYTIVPSYCPITVTCNKVTLGDDGESTLLCEDYEIVDNIVTFNFDQSDYDDATAVPGVHTFEYKVEGGEATKKFTIAVTLIDYCTTTTITQPTDLPAEVEYTLTKEDVVLNFADLGGIFSVARSCVTSVVVGQSDLKDQMSIDDDKLTLSSFTDESLAIVGGSDSPFMEHAVDYTYSVSSQYSGSGVLQEVEGEITFKILNPCHDETITTITIPDQAQSQLIAKFGGPKKRWIYTPATVTPDYCPISIACDSATSPFTCDGYEVNNKNKVELKFELSDKDAPNSYEVGSYFFNYVVSTDGSDNELLEKMVRFKLKLRDLSAQKQKGLKVPDDIPDPCASNPNQEFPINDRRYTIARNGNQKTVVFVGTTPNCVSKLSLTTEPEELANVLRFKTQGDYESIVLPKQKSLDLSGGIGSAQKTYTVTVKYDVYDEATASEIVNTKDYSFEYTIRSPCVNTAFVTIAPPTDFNMLEALQYDVDSEVQFAMTPFEGSFSVNGGAGLCGDVALTPQYEGADLTNASPIQYSQNDNEFLVQTNSDELVGQSKSYGLVASLADWPTQRFKKVDALLYTGTISFESSKVETSAVSCDVDFTQEAKAFSSECTYEQLCNPVVTFDSDAVGKALYTADPFLAWLRDFKNVDASSTEVTNYAYNGHMGCYRDPLDKMNACEKFNLLTSENDGIVITSDQIIVEAGLSRGQWPKIMKFSGFNSQYQFYSVNKCFVVRVDLPSLNDNSDNQMIVQSTMDMSAFNSYVSDVSSSGIVSLAFDEPISTASMDLFSLSNERRLESESAENHHTTISDLLDVKLTSLESPHLPGLPAKWQLQAFDGQVAQLKIDIEGTKEISQEVQVLGEIGDYDNVQLTIKDRAGELTSANGKHIKSGSVNFKIAPFIDHETAERMQNIGGILVSILSIAVTITFVLALFFKGSLITTWLCINTIQILAHVPLVATKLPANAHYFLLNLLCVVRLNFASFNDSIDDLATKIEEGQLIQDKNAYYSSQLHNFGYRYSFTHNMLIIACVALVFALVWLFITIFGKLRRMCQPQSSSTAEASMSNCLKRIALEAHFELMICSFITMSNPDQAGSVWWIVSLACLIGSAIAIVVLANRACKKSMTFEKKQSIDEQNSPDSKVKDCDSNTQSPSIYNTNVPLNQQHFNAPIQFEGGSKETDSISTERGEISTQRGMVNSDNWTEQAVAVSKMHLERSKTEGMEMTSHLEPLMFLLRRTLVAALLVYLPGEPLIASLALLATTLVMLVFNVVMRPFKNAADNNLAIANEALLAIFIGIIGGSSLATTVSDEKFGFALIAFVMMAVFANVVVLMGNACLQIKSLCSANLSRQSQITDIKSECDVELEKIPEDNDAANEPNPLRLKQHPTTDPSDSVKAGSSSKVKEQDEQE